MTNIQIENFLSTKSKENQPVTIHFKGRSPVTGLFIVTKDFNELKTKNLWRIVSEGKLGEYKSTKDFNLARIFNGVEFTKISVK